MHQRSDQRLAINHECMAGFPTVRAHVRILDISTTGCKIWTDSAYARVGSTVILDFTSDRGTAGWIVRVNGEHRAIRFCEQLSIEDMDFLASGVAA